MRTFWTIQTARIGIFLVVMSAAPVVAGVYLGTCAYRKLICSTNCCLF